MRFGITQLVSGGYGRTTAQAYRDSLELICLAEELGFDSAWIAEHHFTDYGLVPNTMQFLAAAAALTERIRLGAAVVVTPLHNPIRMAEEVAALDVLSGGRLDLGVGRGYQPVEYAAFGMDIKESRDRFNDSIAFLRRAFASEEPFDWDSPYFSGRQISIVPRPLQQPHPPLWLACVSESTFEMAGRDGWPIMTSPNFTPTEMVTENFSRYRANLLANGHDPDQLAFPMVQQIYVGADEQAGYEEPREACMNFFHKLSGLLPKDIADGESGGGDGYDQMRKTQRKLADLRYDYLYDNAVMHGTPERVIERIRQLREQTGLDYLIGWFNVSNLDHNLVKASLRRFAEEVMPAFADEPTLLSASAGTS